MRSNLEQSIRVFRSDFLESLTHVHPIMPLVVWSPLVVALLWRSVALHQIPGTEIVAMAVLGVLSWTLIEYTAHRFLFHFKAEHRVSKFLVFLFHGIHHDAPQDKTRLVMPPVGAAIILAILWSLFALAIPSPWIEPFIAFFAIGYLTYDYTHYAVHHFPMRNRVSRYLKRYHMQHHFRMPDRHFGVSSPLWDWVFHTK